MWLGGEEGGGPDIGKKSLVCSRNPDTLGELKDWCNWKVGTGCGLLSERMPDEDKSM